MQISENNLLMCFIELILSAILFKIGNRTASYTL